jgi:cell division septation protein DedD
MFGRSGPLVGLLFLLWAWSGAAAAESASWQTHATAGLQALQEGDTAAAVDQFEAAFSLATELSTADPTLGALLNNLIFAYISAAQFDDAKRAMNLWARIIASNPEAPWAGEQLGALRGLGALLAQTEPREALAAPEPPAETPPPEAPAAPRPAETPVPVPPTTPAEAPAPETPTTPAEALAPETPTETLAAATPVEPPAPPPHSESGYAVHLASFRSDEAAETGWRTLQARYPEQLGRRRLITREITVSDKGTFVRVLTGPFESRAPAEALCASLGDSEQYCAVVKLSPAP